jgi:hypothetical protein
VTTGTVATTETEEAATAAMAVMIAETGTATRTADDPARLDAVIGTGRVTATPTATGATMTATAAVAPPLAARAPVRPLRRPPQTAAVTA